VNTQTDSSFSSARNLQLLQGVFAQLGLHIDDPFAGLSTLSRVGFGETLHSIKGAK